MAHRRLPRFALEYLEGGAEEEAALEGNVEALRRWKFLPRALRDVSCRDTGTSLFGARLPLPAIVAPTGLNGIFTADADRKLSEAAAAAGLPFVQSTMSNASIEDIARVPGLAHWFQLYVLQPWEITQDLIDRADAAGCGALVLTTDAQVFGKRAWSSRNRSSPTRLTLSAALDAALHPRWFASTILRKRGLPQFENFTGCFPRDTTGFFERAFWIRDRLDTALSWDHVRRIREQWKRPLLIKGLLSPKDVARAADAGADGAILSNHGGRQLDWTAAPLDILPAARVAAAGRLALLVDGGVRTGSDILKAVALGADAVLVGRALLYGVAGAGRAGAVRALEILADETARTLALLGSPALDRVGPAFLVRA